MRVQLRDDKNLLNDFFLEGGLQPTSDVLDQIGAQKSIADLANNIGDESFANC